VLVSSCTVAVSALATGPGMFTVIVTVACRVPPWPSLIV